MCISERLKQICELKNWRIKDFAEMTGLPYRTMQGYIGGEREPNAEGMTAIAKVGINLNWLVSGVGEMFMQDAIELADDEVRLIQKYRGCHDNLKEISYNIIKVFSNLK